MFLVRGELIRRYPDAIALTVRQDGVNDADNHPVFSTTQADLLFHAPLSPNITLVGFDLTEVAPDPEGSEWDANVGARLLYKMIGWMLKSQKA